MAKTPMKPGRPKAPRSTRKGEVLSVPVTAEMRKRLFTKAPRGGVAEYVRSLIERDLATG